MDTHPETRSRYLQFITRLFTVLNRGWIFSEVSLLGQPNDKGWHKLGKTININQNNNTTNWYFVVDTLSKMISIKIIDWYNFSCPKIPQYFCFSVDLKESGDMAF